MSPSKVLTRSGACGRLVLTLCVQVVLSGLTTAWLIVRPDKRPRPGIVRMALRDLNETGAVALGCLLSLTPGSTVLDVDLERGEMLLHLLDASDPVRTVSAIRRHFEAPLKLLFPAR